MGQRIRSWQQWVDFFSARADRPLPELPRRTAPRSIPASVAKSLAIFQLGESGGGTIIEQARNSRIAQNRVASMRNIGDKKHVHRDVMLLEQQNLIQGQGSSL